MAEANANPATPAPLTKEEEERLKYLQFVQAAGVHALVTFTNLYIYAKDKAGPLKPRVETMEGTVKNVVGPVYDKYQDVPIGVLKFVDRKVPIVVKQVSSQAISAAQAAPGAARAVATEVQRSGVKETVTGLAKTVYTKYEPKAKELYTAYEPKAEQCAASAWRRLNQLPLFPQVAHVVVPTAAYWSGKYNDTVSSTAEKGYKVSSYLPLVPTERIAKVFGGEQLAAAPLISN
ncbi:REF/SRPP-like protein At3g05500 [Linum perenne]